jgi:AraC family transcriptional regulator of adaptative response / DNA-3-methyladenine glycosylase II
LQTLHAYHQTMTLITDDACYLALKARDARFDGSFFTGVTSTGIYCRPVCRVKTPKRENCRFFKHAALAETAGFRPCLRCRPELAPYSLPWSIQDASSILAHQAARLLDEPEVWGDMAPTLLASRTALDVPLRDATALPAVPACAGRQGAAAVSPEGAYCALGQASQRLLDTGRPGGKTGPTMAALAARLGVSDRHVRRIFESQFGVSPLQYLQTRRLLTAKQLLTDTQLPATQVALISGFSSVRRFNAAFLQHYGLNPSQLRRAGSRPGALATRGIVMRLGYRPPYDTGAMLGFFTQRLLDGVECVDQEAGQPVIGRTLRITAGASSHAGWLRVQFDEAHHQLVLQVSDSLREVLPLVIRRVRATFDLDADPQAINPVLQTRFPHGNGLRVPGALDGFELAVRAVLGQQITVAAARTLAQRLVNALGEPLDTPWPALSRLFPTPAVLAQAGGDALGALGIVRQRQGAIVALARAVTEQRLQLHGGADVQATLAALKELPGIGDWTAQYIAMLALRWPDAFPAGDVALHKALGVQDAKSPAREALAASDAWKPWRSYAVIRAWASLPAPAKTVKQPAAAKVSTKKFAENAKTNPITPTRATR